MAHDVSFTLPEQPLGKVNVNFLVKKNDTVLGRLQLSRGGVDWYPKNAKVPKKFSWAKFAAQLELEK
jgi:hypothetical protein